MKVESDHSHRDSLRRVVSDVLFNLVSAKSSMCFGGELKRMNGRS